MLTIWYFIFESAVNVQQSVYNSSKFYRKWQWHYGSDLSDFVTADDTRYAYATQYFHEIWTIQTFSWMLILYLFICVFCFHYLFHNLSLNDGLYKMLMSSKTWLHLCFVDNLHDGWMYFSKLMIKHLFFLKPSGLEIS